MRNKLVGGMAGLGFLAMAETAIAVPITGFGDPISSPELAGGTIINFDSFSGFFSSVTIGDVTFDVDPEPSIPFEIGADFTGTFNSSGLFSLYSRLAGPQSFTVTFSTPVDAFAFNWGAAEFIWELRAFDSASSLLNSVLLPAVGISNAGEFFGIAEADIAFATLSNTTANRRYKNGQPSPLL